MQEQFKPDAPREVDLYDGHYGELEHAVLEAVRRETYQRDFGQASWIDLAEARDCLHALTLGPGQTALEVGCGSGGITCWMAAEMGARCVGIDINPQGIAAAKVRLERQRQSSQVAFHVVDAHQPLPFPDRSFDAVFCNDSINHLPGRSKVLRDWHRVLRTEGRVLFTDPIVVTGQLSNEEIRVRSSIGWFLFTPPGCNERLLTECGFHVREVRDVTPAVAEVASKWRDARERRREQLLDLEGEQRFEGLQRFLDVVHRLASERRLSRYMYLATKTGA